MHYFFSKFDFVFIVLCRTLLLESTNETLVSWVIPSPHSTTFFSQFSLRPCHLGDYLHSMRE